MISQFFFKTTLNYLFQFFIELNKQKQEKPGGTPNITNQHTKQRKGIKRTQRTTKEIDEKKARKQRNTIDIVCRQCQGK